MKGQAIADQLAECPVEYEDNWNAEFPDESIMALGEELERWQLFFDGAANRRGYGIGIVLVAPDGVHTPIAMRLEFPATNNITEYEACVVDMETALDHGAQHLDVYGDSALIISQIQGKYRTRDSKLKPYHQYLESVVSRFRDVEFHYLPREKNCFADAVAIFESCPLA